MDIVLKQLTFLRRVVQKNIHMDDLDFRLGLALTKVESAVRHDRSKLVIQVEDQRKRIDSLENEIIKSKTNYNSGITDTNKRYICEGDIVNCKYLMGKDDIWVVKFGDWNCTCVDFYCNEKGVGFYFSRQPENEVRGICYFDHLVEVIGNIKSNPELLQDKK